MISEIDDFFDNENDVNSCDFDNLTFSILNENGDAFRVAHEALDDIKYHLGKCLHSGDLTIGIVPWMQELYSYVGIYGAMVSQEDYIRILELVYLIISTPEVDYQVVCIALRIAILVLRSSHHFRTIPNGQLVFRWRPLYENVKRIQKYIRKWLVGNKLSNAEIFLGKVCKTFANFFPAEDIHEIWEVMRVGLDIYHNDKSMFQWFRMFVPNIPLHHSFSLSTWVPFLFSQLILPVPLDRLYRVIELVTKAVQVYAPRMDLTPYLCHIMDIIMRSMPFDVWPNKLTEVGRNRFKVGCKGCKILVAGILSNHENVSDQAMGMPQNALACVLALIRRLKPFLHAQLKDENLKACSVDLLDIIANQLHKRKRVIYNLRVHKSFLGDIDLKEFELRQEQIDLIADELFACFKVFKYHRSCDKFMTSLARLRPSLVIPEMLQEFYLALETVHETPDRLVRSLEMWPKIIKYWAILCCDPNTPKYIPLESASHTIERISESKKALFVFLDNLLPLISVENYKISFLAAPLLMEIGAWFPFINWSDDTSIRKEKLTEDELELLSLTAKFDDYVIDLWNKLEEFFTATTHIGQLDGLISSHNTIVFVMQQSVSLRERLCRSLLDFYLREMLSLTSADVLLDLIELYLMEEFADSLVQCYFPIVLDKLEMHIKEHHLHYNGKADPFIHGLLSFLTRVYPSKLYMFKDRFLNLLHRLMEEREPSICKLVGKLLGAAIHNSFARFLTKREDHESSGWFRTTWNVFKPKQILFKEFYYGVREKESVEFAEQLLNKFVYCDACTLQLLISENTSECKTTDDTAIEAVITRLAFCLGELKLLLDEPLDEENIVNRDNIHAPRTKTIILSHLNDRLVKPIMFPAGISILKYIGDTLLVFLLSIQQSKWKLPLREITLRHLSKLTKIILGKQNYAPILLQRIVAQHNLCLASRGLITVTLTSMQLSCFVQVSFGNQLPICLTNNMKQFVDASVFCLLHCHPPLTAFANESLLCLLSSGDALVSQFILKRLFEEVNSAESLQWTDEQMKRVVKFANSFYKSLNQPNPWFPLLLCDYMNLMSELLQHSIVNKSHEMTHILLSAMKLEFVPHFICKSVEIVNKIAHSLNAQSLANGFLSHAMLASRNGLIEDSLDSTKDCIKERLQWIQSSLTRLLQKTNNLQQANSFQVAAYIYYYLSGLCDDQLLPNHLAASLKVLESKQKILTKVAVNSIISILRNLKSKPPRESQNSDLCEAKDKPNPWKSRYLLPIFDCKDSNSFVLNEETAYHSFVKISSMKSYEGYKFYSTEIVFKLPLVESQILLPQKTDNEKLILIFEAFCRDSVWDSICDMLKSNILSNSKEGMRQLKYLFAYLICTFGCHFLPRVLQFFSFIADEMDRNVSYHYTIGVILHSIVRKTRYLPLPERMQCVKEIASWLLRPELGAASCWLMFKWDVKKMNEYLPFYQYMLIQSSQSTVDSGTIDLSNTKLDLLTHYFYCHSISGWRACREISNIIRRLDEFLYTQQDDLYNINQRNALFVAYAKCLRVIDGSRWGWNMSCQSQTVACWLENAILPALSYYISRLLANTNITVTEEMNAMAQKWPIYLQEIRNVSLPAADISNFSSQHAQYTIRQLIYLVAVCGSHHELFWQTYPLIAELLPIVNLYPALNEKVQSFLDSRERHWTSPSNMYSCEMDNLLTWKSHGSWSCRKLFLETLPRVLQSYAECFFNKNYRSIILISTLQLLQDSNEIVRQTSKTTLVNLLRSGFITVEDDLHAHISLLQKQLRSESRKQIQPNSRLVLEWAIMAIHGSIISSYANEVLSFIPLSLIALAHATNSGNHHVSQMARRELSDFKHANKLIWPKYNEIMSADDFSFVNECAVSGANYYV